jgi:hypothetical protein
MTMVAKILTIFASLTSVVNAVGCLPTDDVSDENVSVTDEELASGNRLPAYGMNYGGLTPEQYHVEHLAAHHMALERAWWSLNEGTNAGDFDAQVRTAAEDNVSILPIIFMTTAITLPDGTTKPVPYTPARDRARWQSFVHDLVVRFGPKTHRGVGTFWQENPNVPYFPIRAWEIWNEENTERFWYGPPSIHDYHDALTAAHASLRSIDPEARVIFGGLIGFNSKDDQEAINALDFLTRVTHMVHGDCIFDAVAVHPYAANATIAVAKVKRMHSQLVQLGLAGKRAQVDVGIWVTEVGWAVGGSWQNNVAMAPFTVPNERVQAQYVSNFATEMDSHREAWGIGPTIWFNYQDLTGVPDSWDHHAGFFTVDLMGNPTAARKSWSVATHAATKTHQVFLPPVRCRTL